MNDIKKVLSTFFGLGLLPGAPGTYASAAALGAYLALSYLGAPDIIVVALLCAAVALCIWLTPWARDHFGKEDPREFVLDEVAGFFLAMLFVPARAAWLAGAVGFVLFRFFDIVKPFPIRRAEKAPHNLGIVADDLLAGVYANIALRLILYFVET
jgi:phosphatidylglycerophosphatase A